MSFTQQRLAEGVNLMNARSFRRATLRFYSSFLADLFAVIMLLANVTVMGVDEKNRTLFLGGLARVSDGFVLGLMDGSGFAAASGLDSPFPLMRHNMLISVGLLCRNLVRGDVFSRLDSTMSFMNDK